MHHHSGLGLLTPFDVHHGLAETRLAAREAVLRTAFAATPDRFVRGVATPPALPQAVWINKPRTAATAAPTAEPGALPDGDTAPRRARGAPEGVAQRARRAGDSGGVEPRVEVAEQAKELHTKL